MQKPTSEEQQKHYFLIKKQFADTGIRLHPQPDIRYPAFRYPLRCNEYPNATQQDTNHAPTGIPSQEKGKNISFPQNDYRDVYRKTYRVVFLFHEKPKC